MKETYKKYLKSLIFILAFLVNIGIEFQDGAVNVEAGTKAYAYSNEYDEWQGGDLCAVCGGRVSDCSCWVVVTACAYCGWQYCNGECQLVCEYCGDPYCYGGNCLFDYGSSCYYCGSWDCNGTCEWSQACWNCGSYSCYGGCLNMCNYCGSLSCYGSCQYQNVCNYCGSSSCYGSCQYQNVCSYCGQSGCYGQCQQNNCGETCNICGGSLGGSLRRGKLRSGDNCMACTCIDPCDQNAFVNTVLNDAVVKATYNSLYSLITSNSEWGAVLNASIAHPDPDYPGDIYTSLTLPPTLWMGPLETSGQNQNVQLTLPGWGNNSSYPCGTIHTHPANSGSTHFDCFSVQDIYNLQDYSELYITAQNNNNTDMMNFIERNVISIVIGQYATYAITVNDWHALHSILANNSYTSMNGIITDNFTKNGYTHEAALLECFGNTINIQKSTNRVNPNFNQFHEINYNNPKQTILTNCP